MSKTPVEGDVTGGVIPYKNPPALISYYMGIASLLFCFLGIPAVILGIMGLNKYKETPQVKGVVHAWIGIVFGVMTTLGMLALIVLVIMASLA